MADVHMNPEYAVRMIRTISRVLAAGKKHRLFGDEVNGCFCLATRSGALILSVSMEAPEAYLPDYRQHAEERIRWLYTRDLLTSRSGEDRNTSGAVAVTGYDFYFSYASGYANRHWNEAIAVVTAIRIGQFNKAVIRDPKWHLKENTNIRLLLTVAHWTE